MSNPLAILTPLNLTKQELQNARIQNLATAPAAPVTGQFYYDTVANHVYVYNGSGWEQGSGASGSGSVTSVALAAPGIFTVSGSPVTTSGTLTLALATQAANNAFIGPTSGGAVAPTFRLLVAADIPTLTAAKISDFDTQVRTSRLDQMAAPTAAVSLNSQRITNLLDPVGAQDAATRNYVDVTVQGLQIKPTALVATTAALPSSTYANGSSGVGATLTATANGVLTIDGYAIVAGDVGKPVLVKDQAAPAQNGLYTVTQAGTAGAPFILTRHVDMDQAGDFSGAFIPVGSAGTVNDNSLWLANPAGTVTVGTTAIPFTELNRAADLVAGTGITIAGNTISVATNFAGGTSIATVGTITAGTWQGTAVAVGFGGTGATTAAGARTNLGATGKYSALIGDGAATSYTITQATHGLATNGQMLVATYDASTGARVYPDESINNTNGTVTISFSVAPATNAYRVVLIG
jgi:hypothetical protein